MRRRWSAQSTSSFAAILSSSPDQQPVVFSSDSHLITSNILHASVSPLSFHAFVWFYELKLISSLDLIFGNFFLILCNFLVKFKSYCIIYPTEYVIIWWLKMDSYHYFNLESMFTFRLLILSIIAFHKENKAQFCSLSKLKQN